MGVIKELKKVKLTEEVFWNRHRLLKDWTNFVTHMTHWTSSDVALEYLHVEVCTRRRSYFVQRIYGRYKRLLPKDELQDILSYMESADASAYGEEGSTRRETSSS